MNSSEAASLLQSVCNDREIGSLRFDGGATLLHPQIMSADEGDRGIKSTLRLSHQFLLRKRGALFIVRHLQLFPRCNCCRQKIRINSPGLSATVRPCSLCAAHLRILTARFVPLSMVRQRNLSSSRKSCRRSRWRWAYWSARFKSRLSISSPSQAGAPLA